MWREVVVSYVKVLSQYSHEGNDKILLFRIDGAKVIYGHHCSVIWQSVIHEAITVRRYSDERNLNARNT
jgi:hypothetical protein